ncbi:heterokaryon incompatibility protein-domain-containing protein [Immersiella caudata]|uniref:Heterokaryon incompatibility protein-domain-containing protein n=1 Tax=Immersiella caudata TaxID=314043 RepID=A0AA40BWE6_9PEZI|nr:heterokaryon incompatibility protein-domain-containing protein [Immersiella caudata]
MANTRCTLCSRIHIDELIELAQLSQHRGSPSVMAHWSRLSYLHQQSLRGLKVSAGKGCDFCRFLLQCIVSQTQEREGPVWLSVHPQNGSGMVLESLLVRIGYDTIHLRLLAPRGSPQHLGGFRIGMFPLDPDLGSQANFNIARGWLTDCRNNHQACPNGNTPPALPTRVLEVGPISSPTCRLVQSNGKKGHYAALSHCWGGPITPVLDKNTLEPFQQNIGLSSLPANFHDAIAITRQLSIQYLWIDSLCIVQDSPEDWEAESAVMGDIYRRSFITISALSSPRSTSGILSPRPDEASSESGDSIDDSESRSLRASSPPGQPAASWLPLSENNPEEIVQVQGPCDVEDLGLVFKLKQAPLLGRGWTLQESILPSRQLFYTSKQIYWRCLQGAAPTSPLTVQEFFQSADGSTSPASCLPSKGSGYPALSAAFHLHSQVYANHEGRGPEPDQTALLADFRRLVGDFTKRSLTVDTDTLPAISGVAQALDSHIDGEYLAGVWSNDIPNGLLWLSTEGKDEVAARRKVEQCRGAPSWSWASSKCPMNFVCARRAESARAGEGTLDLKLVEHGVLPRSGSKNRFGPVADGSWIRLSGLAVPLYSRRKLSSEVERSPAGVVQLDEYPRIRDRELFMTVSGQLECRCSGKSGALEYLAVVASGFVFLLLERSGSSGDHGAVYRRVGIVQVYERCFAECLPYLRSQQVVVI